MREDLLARKMIVHIDFLRSGVEDGVLRKLDARLLFVAPGDHNTSQ